MSDTIRTCPRCVAQEHKGCLNPTTCPCSVCRNLVWSKPPSLKRNRWVPDEVTQVALKIASVKAIPGTGDEWAKIYTFDKLSTGYGIVGRVARGEVKELKKGHWQAKASKNKDGSCGVWLRYIGPLDN